MGEPSPHLIILAGPNGAGKSTAAPLLLSGTLGVQEFVNADTIAKGLSEFNSEAVALEAGRIMLVRLKELATQRANFAFETTLASKAFAPWIRDLRQTGYAFHLLYFWLPNAEMAVARVEHRVRSGGHNVPVETIRRRYCRGLENFFRLYQPIADTWRFYDGSAAGGPHLVAQGWERQTIQVDNAPVWEQVVGSVDHG